MRDFLISAGINARDMFAAFLGAVVAALFMPQATPREIVGIVFAGTVAGNYFGEYVGERLPFGRGASCVLIGLLAMVLTRKLITWASAIEISSLVAKMLTKGDPK